MKVAEYRHDMDCAAGLTQGWVFCSEAVAVVIAQGSSLEGLKATRPDLCYNISYSFDTAESQFQLSWLAIQL